MAGTKRKRAVTATTGKTKKKSMENEDETGGTVEGEERVSKKAKVADGASKLESDPQAVQVRKWRHKLQKTLLTNESLPKEEYMFLVDILFTTVEAYKEMNVDYLTFSKIGKVMYRIHLLAPHQVPRDDEFKFRERAKALVTKWSQILAANKRPSQSAELAETKSQKLSSTCSSTVHY
ncbi:hypothetical protein B0H10DRAFT_2091610 [Mycena sp. CBHHK59/15]|nr:hypothetical protein B0H10DRAFT_2136744 [Mycena sp. CBHHK59/15]KAJ6545803.1 hypothetical protein B0H10DRAFT_2132568 [Mycena sp. CBHHK59/15]KAJ6590902.1 hypothetical protein B0H10DRAFT_2091610 [Mycena sp. CBHHK59/15]